MTETTGDAPPPESSAPPTPTFPPDNGGNRVVWLMGLILAILVLALLIGFIGALRHWFALHTGTLHGGPDVYYNFWSGFGDLGEATLISAVCVGVYTGVRKVELPHEGLLEDRPPSARGDPVHPVQASPPGRAEPRCDARAHPRPAPEVQDAREAVKTP